MVEDGRASDHSCEACGCELCVGFEEHKENARTARESLWEDTKRMQESPEDIVVVTVDMQKGISMPKTPIKDYYFSRKLVLFNETFSEPGKNGKATCYIWHEGEAGSRAFNITSTYMEFARQNRDAKSIIYYCDNCSVSKQVLDPVLGHAANSKRHPRNT